MDTVFLETFVAVAERGSLAAAAQQLNISATAVAQRIRALEEEFGTRLIARTGRTVRPTEAGYAILDRSESFLQSLRDLRTAAAGRSISGELRIGAISTALSGLLPEVMEPLLKAHARLDLYIEPGSSSMLYDRMMHGVLDLAAIVRPRFELPKAAQFQPWRTEPLVLLVPAGEGRTDARTILRSSRYIRYDRRQWGGRLAAEALDQLGIQPAERFELDALDAIAVMVSRGLGVSIVPDWTGPWPEGVAVRRIALPGKHEPREIGLVWLRSSPRIHLIRALLDFCD